MRLPEPSMCLPSDLHRQIRSSFVYFRLQTNPHKVNPAEYPMEDLQEQVKRDISENANSEPFVVSESEATDCAAVEPEKVVENDENVPDFMKG